MDRQERESNMAAAKKQFVALITLFVTLDPLGSVLDSASRTEIPPGAANTRASGNRTFRFTFGGFEGSEPGVSVARNYSFGKKELKEGYTQKLGVLPVKQAAKVAEIMAKICQAAATQPVAKTG